jgi:hypothetical protein
MRLSVQGPFEPMNVDVLDCVLDVVITKCTGILPIQSS